MGMVSMPLPLFFKPKYKVVLGDHKASTDIAMKILERLMPAMSFNEKYVRSLIQYYTHDNMVKAVVYYKIKRAFKVMETK